MGNIKEVEIEGAKTLFAAVTGPPVSVEVSLALIVADDG